MRPRHPHHRRRTTTCGELVVGIQLEVDPEELALLLEVGNGDVSAGIIAMARTLEALPADMLAELEAQARTVEELATDTDQP